MKTQTEKTADQLNSDHMIRLVEAAESIAQCLGEIAIAQDKMADILERLTFTPSWCRPDDESLMLRVTTADD